MRVGQSVVNQKNSFLMFNRVWQSNKDVPLKRRLSEIVHPLSFLLL